MVTEIKNGYRYSKEFRKTVLAEFHRRKKSKRGKKVGVTYREIAKAFNIDPNTVIRWVTGKRKYVTAQISGDNLKYKGVTYIPEKRK